jgi:mono/diheme cytochrome c family protein
LTSGVVVLAVVGFSAQAPTASQLAPGTSSPAAAAGSEVAWTSTLDGVFTEGQAARGEDVYYQECASCHGATLTGGDGTAAPPLAGKDFLEAWSGKSVADFVKRLRDTMPLDSPGRLSQRAYADLTAFVLKANEFPAGGGELGADLAALGAIRIESVPRVK